MPSHQAWSLGAEDAIEEAQHRVKQSPFHAIGIVFAAGVLTGAMCFTVPEAKATAETTRILLSFPMTFYPQAERCCGFLDHPSPFPARETGIRLLYFSVTGISLLSFRNAIC